MHQPESAIPQNNRQVIIGCLFVLLGALGFSAKAVLIKLAYAYSHQLDAITLMVLRMAISLPFFLAVALWSANDSTQTNDAQRLNRLDWLMIFGLGILGYYVASLLDFAGLQYISAGLERLILFLYPTFVVLFTAAIQRRTINRHQAVALGLSYAGMILVFVDNMTVMTSSGLLLGSSLILCSAIAFAFFLMGSGMMVKRIGSTRFTAYSMTVACLATGLHFVIQHGVELLNLPESVYWLALIMAIFSTVLPAFLMNAGIRRIGAGSASIISSIGPIGTLALAFLLLGETLTIAQLAGTALVLVGVYVVSRAKV
ncbi:MAG: DMT family transporter [Methylobacter tundripaludum]|uniref:Threonine/homoserine efflux transporter RhtA n=1 Tax=Methylobacter tundripaludum TaxID=173365 RepID=A0A2S6H5H7_9GAMM|nr:DMT family transporter [Methylobacter tundripaludum]MCK9636128.1 DMT family transporter [Methylobacter tundripaludum]PPK72707.1 threonine/homoserine efflux transporter RhtA [Methylobacter tundripaludum]